MPARLKYFGNKRRAELSDIEQVNLKVYKERFSKWHNKQIDLLTFSINLIFTISVAVAGFVLNNQDKGFFKDKLIWQTYSLTKTTLFTLALSSTCGIIALLSRLNDFRLTKNVIAARRRIYELDNDIKYEASEHSNKRQEEAKRDCAIYWATFLGRVTWVFFYAQITLLLSAFWGMVLAV